MCVGGGNLICDLPKRVILTIEEGLSCRQATTKFDISVASTIRWYESYLRTHSNQPGVGSSPDRQERLLEHFVSGSTARCAARLVGVNKTTAAYYYQRLREILAYQCEQESFEVFDG